MKRIAIMFFAALCGLSGLLSCTGGDGCGVKLATYNIRGDLPRDTATVNAWRLRRDSLCKVVQGHGLDIVCMQEVKANQLADMEERMDYAFAGIRGLYNPIFYNAVRFELLHTETFWLSETMEVFSKGWDGKYDRYCTWAQFRDRKSRTEFFVFNTHLDHRGVAAQKEGAALIVREALRIASGAPLFICGDMNSTDTTEAYKELASVFADSRTVAAKVDGPVGTAHSFGTVEPVRIDYVFVNDKVRIYSYDVDDVEYPDGMYPSDHRPVIVESSVSETASFEAIVPGR